MSFRRTRQPRGFRPLSGLLLILATAVPASGSAGGPRQAAPAAAQQANPQVPTPSGLRIESFGPTRLYSVGTELVTLSGAIRNTSASPSQAGAVAARLSCIAGLDYFEGDTIPKLPAIEPGQNVSYKWRVQPTSNSGPMVAAFALEVPGSVPEVSIAPIYRFVEAPPGDSASSVKAPAARADTVSGVVENERIRARIATTESGVPCLLLSALTTTGWKRVGVSLPLAEVLSAEGLQNPWWEVFRVEEVQARTAKGEASLSISGGFGLRWRGTVILTVRAGSAVLDYQLRIAPLRDMKIWAVRYAQFAAGHGTFGSTASDQLNEASGPNALSAVRFGSITTGRLAPQAGPFAEWQSAPLPEISGAEYRMMGMEQRTSGAPVALARGGLIELRARLFAMFPSTDVRDAFKVTLPAR